MTSRDRECGNRFMASTAHTAIHIRWTKLGRVLIDSLRRSSKRSLEASAQALRTAKEDSLMGKIPLKDMPKTSLQNHMRNSNSTRMANSLRNLKMTLKERMSLQLKSPTLTEEETERIRDTGNQIRA